MCKFFELNGIISMGCGAVVFQGSAETCRDCTALGPATQGEFSGFLRGPDRKGIGNRKKGDLQSEVDLCAPLMLASSNGERIFQCPIYMDPPTVPGQPQQIDRMPRRGSSVGRKTPCQVTAFATLARSGCAFRLAVCDRQAHRFLILRRPM